MRLCAFAICVVLCWTGLAGAHPLSGRAPLAEIPYDVDYEGWVTVEVVVNGQGPYKFIVDTGATATAVFANLAARQDFAPANRPPVRILGLTEAKRLPPFSIGDVGIAGHVLEDHVGVILPDWEPPRQTPQGVLGLDFLARYTVLFDIDAGVIRLYDPAQLPDDSARGWSRERLIIDDFGQQAGALYRISVDVNRHKFQCVVDMGASGTLLNYAGLRRLFSGLHINRSGSPGFSTGSRVKDVFDNTAQARLARVQRIKIAGARWRDQIVTVYDALIFSELGMRNTPFCLIGTDLMLQYHFIFDFEREELYMGPEARRPPADTG